MLRQGMVVVVSDRIGEWQRMSNTVATAADAHPW